LIFGIGRSERLRRLAKRAKAERLKRRRIAWAELSNVDSRHRVHFLASSRWLIDARRPDCTDVN
jgi:hypothetical protein